MARKKSVPLTPPTLALPTGPIAQELGIRARELWLTPAQAAEILQTTTDQLSIVREVGDGPPFTKLGDGLKMPVSYRLGKLRDWVEKHTFQNTSRLNASRFLSLADFPAKGALTDSFATASDADRDTFEFQESVGSQRDIVDVRWMRVDDMLEAFRRQANWRHAEAEEISGLRSAADRGIGTGKCKQEEKRYRS